MKIQRRIVFLLFVSAVASALHSQPSDSYPKAFKELNDMLNGTIPLDFKRAVFVTENAYKDNTLDYGQFCAAIRYYTEISKGIARENALYYNDDDYEKIKVYSSVFRMMTDTVRLKINDSTRILLPPFRYNFDDFAGDHNWANMFVTTLLETRKGNCHSLPFLYKIVVEELGERTWLALAPNHIYIKLQNKQSGWYNTELTSGQFPTDAWLMASGYIHMDAVSNGIYMDTLSQRQSIALCLVDLAQGYQRKSKDATADFAMMCCDTALHYFPYYINGLLLKTDILSKRYRAIQNKKSAEAKALLASMEQLYTEIHRLGYRQMPKQNYLPWINQLTKEKEKYKNRNMQ
jgi:hypothetical protein